MSVKRTRTWTYLTFYCSRQPYWTASTHSRHWTPWKHSSVNVIAHSQLLKWPALFISYQCNKHITLIKQQIISLTKHATVIIERLVDHTTYDECRREPMSVRLSCRLKWQPEPYRDRVATTEVQNAWSSRDSRRLQIVPGSALAGNSNCKNRVTELRFLVISRQ